MARPKRKRKPRALIVDDDALACKVFRYMLDASFTVKVAGDEARALEQARLMRFDVVLMDIHLGGDRTGIDVLAALRELPGYDAVPIIAVTAFGLEGAREHLIELGFDEFVAKPCNRAVLLRAMEQQMDRYARPDRPPSRPSTPCLPDHLLQSDWIRWPD